MELVIKHINTKLQEVQQKIRTVGMFKHGKLVKKVQNMERMLR